MPADDADHRAGCRAERDLERAIHAERHPVLTEALDGEDVGNRPE